MTMRVIFLFLVPPTPTAGPNTYEPTMREGYDKARMIAITLPKFPNENGNITYGYCVFYFLYN